MKLYFDSAEFQKAIKEAARRRAEVAREAGGNANVSARVAGRGGHGRRECAAAHPGQRERAG